ncbi:MAG: tetratricopeptide repeat protein, partial [Candidatus Nanoarchaeia archaeon]
VMDRCKVRSINVLRQGEGSIEISCRGERLFLSIGRSDVELEIDGEKRNAEVGDMIGGYEMVYVGAVPGGVNQVGGKGFVVFTNKVDEDVISEINKRIEDVESEIRDGNEVEKDDFIETIKKGVGGWGADGKVAVLIEGDEINLGDEDDKKVKFLGWDAEVGDEDYSDYDNGQIVERYFDNNEQAIDYLLEHYPQESEGDNKYGAIALYERIELARELKKFDTANMLVDEFLDRYPDSELAREVDSMQVRDGYDFSKSSSSVKVNNRYYSVSVEDFKPVIDAGQVRLEIDGRRVVKELYDKVYYNGKDKDDGYLIIRELKHDRARLEYWEYDEKDKKKDTFTLKEGERDVKGGVNIRVLDIDVEKQAKVDLIPEMQTSTEANFTFKIGIEKRGIQLSPEKTKEMIENINNTIEDWEDINDKLGNLVKSWKGACFATSTVLMLKNMVSGLSGETMARQHVMEGYRDRCDRLVESEQYTSRSKCYTDLSDEINSDVSKWQQAIQETN